MAPNDLESLMVWSNDLYKLVLVIMDHMKQPRCYGSNDLLNMVEMHTLSMIAAEPGICVSDIAKKWNRTLSAASRNINRLQKKGYIQKNKEDGNNKTVHLYVTETGQQLVDFHQDYDIEVTQDFFQYITRKYSMEELSKFNSISKDIQAFYDSYGSENR